jgi:choice-of-anchor A domain-containing protein
MGNAAGPVALSIPQAQAGFALGDAANFAVLFEGSGGQQLLFSNSGSTGNIGIGSNGAFASGRGCTGSCLVTGTVEFSAASTGQFNSGGTTISGGETYGNANVQTDLNTLNSLSQPLGGETATALTISSGGSVNASSGTTDSSGNEVLTLQAASSFPNGTFTLNGDGSGTQTVVVNVPAAFAFNGSIVLTGGLTSDQILFNFAAGDYSTLSGGGTLTISSSRATTTGIFLDPNGNIQINHPVLDGRIFGGDTQNISGANIFAAPPPRTPSSPARLR